MPENAMKVASDLQKRERARALICAVLSGAIFSLVCLFLFGDEPGVDLLPLWLAGEAFASGNLPIYQLDETVFTFAVPQEWRALAADIGEGGSVLYPFVYAPIWAPLMGSLTKVTDFSTFRAIFSVLNPFLLVMTVWLTWRAAPLLSFPRHLILGFLLLCLTSVGLLPIMGNQIQITVSLLLALVWERSRNGDQLTAGSVLAFAAALKLYPALFALLFIATRQNKALISFLIVGTSIGLLSILCVGWALHAELLMQLSTISRTILQINLSMNLDSLLLPLGERELIFIPPDKFAYEKTGGWLWVSRALLTGFLLIVAIAGRKIPAVSDHPLLWPFAFLVVAYLGPLSWAFYYITPMAAAPLLAVYLPRLPFAIILVAVAVGLSFLTLVLPFPTPAQSPPLQFWGSASLLVLTLAFAFAMIRSIRQANSN